MNTEQPIETKTDDNLDTKNRESLSYEQLEAQLAKIEATSADNFEKFVRTQAEMENLRRRMQRDLEAAHKYSLEKIARELLPIIDNLERTLEHEHPDAQALMEGVKMTLNLFQNTLAKFSIQEINPVQQAFDPKLHEAMSTQANSEVDPGTVLQVLQKGYLLHDRLLRPALVIVAKALEN